MARTNRIRDVDDFIAVALGKDEYRHRITPPEYVGRFAVRCFDLFSEACATLYGYSGYSTDYEGSMNYNDFRNVGYALFATSVISAAIVLEQL